jgi:hypothetical protein
MYQRGGKLKVYFFFVALTFNISVSIFMHRPKIYIGADSQLNGATKYLSMGQMKNIQLGGFKNV